MKNPGAYVVALAAIIISQVNETFAFDPAQWRYNSQIILQENTKKLYKLTLTPAVYHSARTSLADIRITDSGNIQIPYILLRPSDSTRSNKYSPAILNRSVNSAGASTATLDFGQKKIKNHIEIMTRGNNFRRAVKVEGSDDNIEFFTLLENAFVFAINSDTRFEKVDLPENDFRYLRVSVSPMPDEDAGPLIEEIGVYNIEAGLAERQPVEMKLTEKSENEKENSSIYIFDLGFRQLPISEMRLEINEASFYRHITIEGRDDATRKVEIPSEDNRRRFNEIEVPWERITNGTIYRYSSSDEQKHEQLLLRIPPASRAHRYIKLTINNYNDKPVTLESASAKMIAHQIIFEINDNAPFTFYVGSEKADKPKYDLEQRLGNLSLLQAGTAILGGIVENPLFVPVGPNSLPWTEKHKILLLSVLVTVALVLGVFIMISFKSIHLE